jgi:type I restriction enzyme, S subunit
LKETEVGPIPESWKVVSIGEVYDFTKKPKEIIYSNYDYIPFIAMDLIPIGTTHLRKFKFKKVTEISSGTYVGEGDILLAKITPCFENGKQCIITGLPNGFGIASTEVIPIKEKPGISDKYFLYYYLLKEDIRKLIAGKMEGATGRQRVPVHLMRETLIPFPPLPEQQEIAKLFLTIEKRMEIHTSQKLILQDFFKTMLNKLMTGEIRVKDLDNDTSEVSA